MSMVAPAGFMPAWGKDGLSIELCSGGDAAPVQINRDDPNYELLALIHGGDSNDGDEASDASGCDFANVDGKSLPVPAQSVSDAGLGWTIHPIAAPLRSPYLAQHRNRPPATGPPAFS